MPGLIFSFVAHGIPQQVGGRVGAVGGVEGHQEQRLPAQVMPFSPKRMKVRLARISCVCALVT